MRLQQRIGELDRHGQARRVKVLTRGSHRIAVPVLFTGFGQVRRLTWPSGL